MKTNKINVVLSLNKTVVSRYSEQNNYIGLAGPSTAKCTAKTTNGDIITDLLSKRPDLCIPCNPNLPQTGCKTGSY